MARGFVEGRLPPNLFLILLFSIVYIYPVRSTSYPWRFFTISLTQEKPAKTEEGFLTLKLLGRPDVLLMRAIMRSNAFVTNSE